MKNKITNTKEQYVQEAKDQYEMYPYPLRNPDDEKTRLISTYGEFLGLISHYGFKGKQTFKNKFRALIAGGGTGDAVIYLSEQLRDTDAEIVYMDLSQASMDIAKKRAESRGLTNITWVLDSLLSLPKLNIGKFDYINCVGVLHHLPVPEEGLQALKSVLKDPGLMIILTHAKYGRTGVQHVQELMRLVHDGSEDMRSRTENTKAMLGSLPDTNWWKRGGEMPSDHKTDGDIGVFGLFLHSEDRAYSIPEIYEYVEGGGLHLVEFTVPEMRHLLKPEMHVKDPVLLEKIKKYDIKRQHAISEIIVGNLYKHVFYVSNQKDTIASLDDLNNVPYFVTPMGDLFDVINKNPGQSITVTHPQGMKLQFQPRRYTKHIFKYLDGKRSLKEIFDCVRDEWKNPSITDEELLVDLRFVYELFNSLDWMLLRDKSIPLYITLQDLQDRMKKQSEDSTKTA